MAKLAQSVSKYNVTARFEANGVVEKPDVIGAVFGQTEGLLGSGMDLRELQQTGRIGRIDVKVENKNGKSVGSIIVPSSLDSAETALIAASLETIERIGPCEAKIKIDNIQDLRDNKREFVVNRAKELLSRLAETGAPESEEIAEKIKEAIRIEEVVDFHGCPAGPDVFEADNIVLVEGRADVVNLLRHGIKNAIAIGGTGSTAREIIASVTKEKTAVAFLDGDRGGDLILKELMQFASLDFVARAPEGKEVEELTKKEVYKSLRERVPMDQVKFIDDRTPKKTEERPHQKFGEQITPRVFTKPQPDRARKRIPRTSRLSEEARIKLLEVAQDIVGTKAVCIFNEDMEVLGRVPLTELDNALRQVRGIYAMVIDGSVDRTFIRRAERYSISVIVAEKVDDAGRTSVTVLTPEELAA